MGLYSTLKKGLSWGFAPKRWVGLEQVKANGKICSQLAKGLFARHYDSTASNAIAHSQFQPKKYKLFVLISVYSLSAIGSVVYAGYLFFNKGFFLPGLVSLALMFLFISYGIRELIIYAQFKRGRNHFRFRELFKILLKGFRNEKTV